LTLKVSPVRVLATTNELLVIGTEVGAVILIVATTGTSLPRPCALARMFVSRIVLNTPLLPTAAKVKPCHSISVLEIRRPWNTFCVASV